MSKSNEPEVSGSVSATTKQLLWGIAGGRCQYRGCNKRLIGDLVSGNDKLVRALVAHIISAKAGGPRGHPIRSPQLVDDISNLMLLCYEHHRLIDVEDEAGHPEHLLLPMKAAHEERINILTDLTADRETHLLTYGAPIGSLEAPLSYQSVRMTVLPDRYPAGGRAIHLEMKGCRFQDHEPDYWTFQQENLARQFRDRVSGRIEAGDIRHLSVFGLAPQALLIELGRLLCDICPIDVHQLKREPKGWGWLADGDPIKFQAATSGLSSSVVALKLALSATVTDDRIQRVLGDDVPIWSITAEAPHNDVMRRADDLRAFRRLLRRTFDEIKTLCGHDAEIHVFPALPLSAAIETGRVWMPKADLPLVIYDENRRHGGFMRAIRVDTTRATAPYLAHAS
jgi:hypothetical protein